MYCLFFTHSGVPKQFGACVAACGCGEWGVWQADRGYSHRCRSPNNPYTHTANLKLKDFLQVKDMTLRREEGISRL